MLILPRKLILEYRSFVESDPVVSVGKTHLEFFMMIKGLIKSDKQKTLEVFS